MFQRNSRIVSSSSSTATPRHWRVHAPSTTGPQEEMNGHSRTDTPRLSIPHRTRRQRSTMTVFSRGTKPEATKRAPRIVHFDPKAATRTAPFHVKPRSLTFQDEKWGSRQSLSRPPGVVFTFDVG